MGDILAMTGYMPKSMFNCSVGGNTFSSNALDQPFGACSQSAFPPSYSAFPAAQEHLHRSTTVPSNLPAFSGQMHHGGYYDSTFFLPMQAQQQVAPYGRPHNGFPVYPQSPFAYDQAAGDFGRMSVG